MYEQDKYNFQILARSIIHAWRWHGGCKWELAHVFLQKNSEASVRAQHYAIVSNQYIYIIAPPEGRSVAGIVLAWGQNNKFLKRGSAGS